MTRLQYFLQGLKYIYFKFHTTVKYSEFYTSKFDTFSMKSNWESHSRLMGNVSTQNSCLWEANQNVGKTNVKLFQKTLKWKNTRTSMLLVSLWSDHRLSYQCYRGNEGTCKKLHEKLEKGIEYSHTSHFPFTIKVTYLMCKNWS